MSIIVGDNRQHCYTLTALDFLVPATIDPLNTPSSSWTSRDENDLLANAKATCPSFDSGFPSASCLH